MINISFSVSKIVPVPTCEVGTTLNFTGYKTYPITPIGWLVMF